MATPTGWIADTSDPVAPVFEVEGVRLLSLPRLRSTGDAAARMAMAIKLQYLDAAGVKREELSGGRVWMVKTEENRIHARTFVPFDSGVLMAVALVRKEGADRLGEIRRAFDTVVATEHELGVVAVRSSMSVVEEDRLEHCDELRDLDRLGQTSMRARVVRERRVLDQCRRGEANDRDRTRLRPTRELFHGIEPARS
jgi:hypothetical protein